MPAFRNPALERARRSGGAASTAATARARVHHRLVRGHADLLPRRRHRRARGQRHGQRPRDGRRASARRCRSRSSSRRGCRSTDLRRVIESVQRAADARRRARSSPATPRWSAAAAATRSSSTPRASASCPPGVELGSARVRPGDAILLSGTIGDHGDRDHVAQREGLELDGDARERHRAAPRAGRARCSTPARASTRCAIRRAAASPATLVEIASRQQLGHRGRRGARSRFATRVRGACEILGLDPLLVANEGKLVAFVPEAGSRAVLGGDARASARPGRGAHRHVSPKRTPASWSLLDADRRTAHPRSPVRRGAAAHLLAHAPRLHAAYQVSPSTRPRSRRAGSESAGGGALSSGAARS